MKLGNIHIRRDWGWAPEYVEVMWRMLNYSIPEDFVIATGVTQSLQEFIATVFSEAGLDWQVHVVFDPTLHRPSDPSESSANPNKAKKLLLWAPDCIGSEVPRRMYKAECNQYSMSNNGEHNVQA